MRTRGGGDERWKNRAAGSTDTYVEGARNPRKPWAEATAAAESNYNEGISKSIAKKSFGKGVRKAGDSKHLQGIETKGASRYASGIAFGQAAYASGVAPYLQVIESISLPPRGVKGDPRNLERVSKITTALSKKRAELKG